MKQFKLIMHTKTFSNEELIINYKEYPGIKEKDIIEIYHPEDEFSRLLLQVPSLKEEIAGKGRDTISVERSIATSFQLRNFSDVYVNIVNPAEVALESVELTFKDQYLGRSEMWRLKNGLVNTCVYLNKKIEYCGASIRCQVYEMWSQGDRVACGVITDDTKIVFRSSTSMVYLFIQMSSEMWDFDIHGDLYFEKAVNGFLSDLFAKWKKNGSNHEVTIVLFSRTFYKAKSLDEFPQHMRECLQVDYRRRFYEDFYRVAVQNERYEDWSNILLQLRRLFTDYQKIVLQYHERPNIEIPSATNSTAAQGNFLEVLNMSLNVFEKHYLDRSFDRTGQLSVVITPGVGVFEVDRELTNVTKQRIIDNGVGSDLVCVGEQPLHAVPLLKFHNKDTSISSVDDYSMPHWINLSFYSTNKKVAYSNFTPRIKLPPRRTSEPLKQMYESNRRNKLLKDDEYIHNSLFDYDAYDAHVFQLPPANGTCLQRVSRTKKTSVAGLEGIRRQSPPSSVTCRRKMSDPDIHHNIADILSGTTKQTCTFSTMSELCPENSGHSDGWVSSSPNGSNNSGSYAPIIRTGRALINPFDPSHVTVKLTSNRRRWTHIFPKGPTGLLIQQHHYQARPMTHNTKIEQKRHNENNGNSAVSDEEVSSTHTPLATPSHQPPSSPFSTNNSPGLQVEVGSRKRLATGTSSSNCPSAPPTPGNAVVNTPNSNNAPLALLWGATGEQEWTPALTTGVDWKSLTIPACLPITTDYFPDKRSLQNDYLVSNYNLLPDDVNADFAQNRAIYKDPLSTMEVFKELVSQRLAQGFQLIVGVNELETVESGIVTINVPSAVAPPVARSSAAAPLTRLLSIGRIFHKISLLDSTITVTRYRPRHPYAPFNIHYRYRFHAPNHDTYEVSWVSFTTEKLENFNWNYIDHYICTRGDTDFPLAEPHKYWRFRTLILPLHNPATKKILDGNPHCDIYPTPTRQDLDQHTNGFLRMTELHLNKVKRPNSNTKPKANIQGVVGGTMLPSSVASQHHSQRRHSTSNLARQSIQIGVSNSPFRERIGSTRLPDRPRIKLDAVSSSKTMVERARSQAGDPDSQNDDISDDGPVEPRLRSNTSLQEIVEAMKNATTGVGFLVHTVSLPSYAFVSIYAIQWLMTHVEGVTTVEKAKKIMETLLQEKLICHASGEFSKEYIVGYYMYHIVASKSDYKDGKDISEYIPPLGDLQSFENEWMEVEVLGPRSPMITKTIPQGAITIGSNSPPVIDEAGVPAFLCSDIDSTYMQLNSDSNLPLYKRTHLDIDVNCKSDRIEWGHARYQATFRPDQAYEMCVQWLTASGNIVADLIFGWARKAHGCGLHMVPIPADPLALPFTSKSDPLRGPIYVPLNEEPLMKNKAVLFEGFSEDTWSERLFLFQEAIVNRFGFIKCTVESTSLHTAESDTGDVGIGDYLYVHVTGNMFILIPTNARPQQQRTSHCRPVIKHINASRYPVHSEVAPSPHEAYITRHVSGKNKDEYDTNKRMGFLWSWNHMLSKKWRSSNTPATGDEMFQMKMLRDFKHFCANHEQRLTQFWDQSWELKEHASNIISIV